ncbi:MAG: hypothetical protein ACYDG3_02600 [Bacillati bacterium]
MVTLSPKATPKTLRCYVLDEAYRVVLASRSTPDDPLNHLFGAQAPTDALPPTVDRAVRALTASWGHDGCPGEPAMLYVWGVRASVMPLHGPFGRHIAVFVERPEQDTWWC